MPQCIYCKISKPIEQFSNREHVIPQSFGTFKPHNLILNQSTTQIKQVCNNCNNLFSGLEIFLARDSYEGYILRSKYQNIQKNIDRRRIILKLREGELKGVYVHLIENNTINFEQQIGVKTNNGHWEYFLLDELHKFSKEKYSLEEGSLRSFGISEQQAKLAFNEIGINFVKGGEIPLPAQTEKLLCDISYVVDNKILRAIAKIAFNFFAYFNPEAVLDNSFDTLRNFILNNIGTIKIQSSTDPILHDETRNGLGRLGHIITIDRYKYDSLIVQVSLFNHLTYRVWLSERKWTKKEIKFGFGKFFDISSKKILHIDSSKLYLIPLIIIPEKKLWLPPFYRTGSN